MAIGSKVDNAKKIVLLAPQPGPQTLLLTCPIGDVLFGGARGGGKTLACILDWISHSNRHGRHAKGMWLRRSQPEIEEAQGRMMTFFPAIGGVFAVQARTWTLPNGASLKLRYLESDQDASRYQGHEYTWLCLDDMGTWKTSAPIDMLRATLRSAAGVPPRMVATANPGGVGHAWIKARYVDPAPPLTPFVGADGQQRVFIPSRLTDNRKLLDSDPTYIDRLKASGPPWLVKAWLDGDWNASQEGAVIKREWLGYTYDVLPTPEEQRKERAKLVVSVDCAASMGSSADYTAIVVALHCGHHVYVRHVRRGKWEFPALAAQVQQVCEQFQPQIVLIENKSNGLALIPYVKKQPGWKWSIVPVEPKGSKAERLYAQTHWMEGGRLLLPQAADWLAGFVGELLGFDDTSAAKRGQHDDQVDALTQLLQYCNRGGYQLPDW
jgi:predicted phage terminase large subunit-like protein